MLRHGRWLEEPSDEMAGSSSVRKDVVSLPLSEVNLVVLTDVHSWIAGHERHEPGMNVNYGDVLAFYQHLKEQIRISQQPMDLFMVMNGDFMDGTGLSTIPPTHLTPLLEEMPFSIINLGNHELYDDRTVDWIRKEFIPHWNGNYLTSNTILTATGEPLGNRYTYLRGHYSTLLVFGFLYNFQDNCPSTIVQQVQTVVKQEWFVQAVMQQEDYDAILVMAHMHVTDPLVEVIRLAIRDLVGPTMPIQFITGHTHIRAFAQLDDHATSFEAGRFLDTIGFCSFATKHTHVDSSANNTSNDQNIDQGTDATSIDQAGNERSNKNLSTVTHDNGGPAVITNNSLFHQVFLEPNRQALSAVLESSPTHWEHIPSENLDSTDGKSLSEDIAKTQEQLGLNTILGCSSQTYLLEAPMDQKNSLWGLYMYQIVPSMLFPTSLARLSKQRGQRHSSSSLVTTTGGSSKSTTSPMPILVQGTGAFRYNLFEGSVVFDDVIAVCPFNDTIYQVAHNLSGTQLLHVLNLNVTSKYPNQVVSATSKYATLPPLAISTNQPIHLASSYHLFTSHFHVSDMKQRVEHVLGYPIPEPEPVVMDNDDHDNAYGRKSNATSISWTTTNLWKSYVENHWPCPNGSESSSVQTSPSKKITTSTTGTTVWDPSPTVNQNRPLSDTPVVVTQEERPMTVVFFMALIVGGVYLYQKRKEQLERSGYIPIGDPTMTLLRSSTSSRSLAQYH